MARLGREVGPRAHRLTAGRPLRQLYASRFPALYPWVLRLQEIGGRATVGPTMVGIGVRRWINAYTSGDYVGRWLWSRPPLPHGDRSNTIIDELDQRYDVYRAPADAAALRARLRGCAHPLLRA